MYFLIISGVIFIGNVQVLKVTRWRKEKKSLGSWKILVLLVFHLPFIWVSDGLYTPCF